METKSKLKFKVEVRGVPGLDGWRIQGTSKTLENAEKLASRMRSHGLEARVLVLE